MPLPGRHADLTEIDGKAIAGKATTASRPLTAGYPHRPLHQTWRSTTCPGHRQRAKEVEGSVATLSLAGVADGEHVLKAVRRPARRARPGAPR
jgi:hypothetical protein